MDIKQYQYILKVAEVGSITKAASELYITQPSLSGYIAKIEEELGTAIFNRNTNPISLTFAGEVYLETAQKVLQLENEMRSTIVDIAHNKKGRIIIGDPGGSINYILPKLFSEFWKRYPMIKLQIIEDTADAIEKALINGDCDISLVPFTTPNNKLEYELLFDAQLKVAADKELLLSVEHPLTGNADFTLLAKLPFILLKKGYGIRRWTDEIFESLDINPEIAMETYSSDVAYMMACAGLGVTVIYPNVFTENWEKSNSKIALLNTGKTWSTAAVYKKGSYVNQAKRELINIAKEIGRNRSFC